MKITVLPILSKFGCIINSKMPFSFFRIKVTYEVSSKLLAWSLVWSILRKFFPFHYYNSKHTTSGFQNYGQTTDFCVDNTRDASGNIVEIALKCEVFSLTKVPLFVFLRFDSVLKERLFLIYCSHFWGAFNDKGAFFILNPKCLKTDLKTFCQR